MPAASGLARVLQLRTLEEEQRRDLLDSAMAELHRLEAALRGALTRERRGREGMARASGSPTDRVAGRVEHESARRSAALLRRRMAATEQQAAELRRAYLEKRTERRQAETLVRQAEALQALEDARRDQEQLDDQFATRLHHARHDSSSGASRPAAAKHEMKNRQESGPLPEAEQRSIP